MVLKKKTRILLLFILILIAASYLPVINGFFQQDEWLDFGVYYSLQGKSLVDILFSFFQPRVSHWVPLSRLINHFYTFFFGTDYVGRALASLFSHLVVVILVFWLSFKLMKDEGKALLAAIIFGLASSHHQATSWVAADVNTHGAAIFALLSIIFFLDFSDKYQRGKLTREFWLSIIFLIISLLFKEIALTFFLLLPLTFYLLVGKRQKKSPRVYIILALVAIMFLIFRGTMTSLASREHPQDRVIFETQSLAEVAMNLGLQPIRALSQTVIPSPVLLRLAREITPLFPSSLTGIIGTTEYDRFVEQLSLQILNFLVVGFCLSLFLLFISRDKKSRLNKVAVFALFFVVLNSFIYAFSPARSGYVPVIDSRNLYFPAVGTAILLVILTTHFVKDNLSKTLLVLVPLLLLNVCVLNYQLTTLSKIGTLRKQILTQIKTQHPDLPRRTVFYTESDSPFYGLPEDEKIMPFQVNFGYTLLIWYQEGEDFPNEFVDGRVFFTKIDEENYLEANGQGFGYFRTRDKLAEAIQEKNLTPDSLIAYRYTAATQYLEDISDVIREEMWGKNNASSF